MPDAFRHSRNMLVEARNVLSNLPAKLLAKSRKITQWFQYGSRSVTRFPTFFVGKHIKLRGAYNFARRFGGELKRNLLIPFNNWVDIPNLAI